MLVLTDANRSGPVPMGDRMPLHTTVTLPSVTLPHDAAQVLPLAGIADGARKRMGRMYVSSCMALKYGVERSSRMV
jgi:hypothetical protein